MEASSVCKCNSIVPEALDESNNKTWSYCMEAYLSGQDLWDVINEPEPKLSDSSKHSIVRWKKKNSMALHAIVMSCSPNFVSKVMKVKSAKRAWDLLAEGHSTDSDNNDNNNSDIAKDDIDYDPFIKAAHNIRDWETVEKFIARHPQAVTAKVFSNGFATNCSLLPYLLHKGQYEKADLLVNHIMVPYDMEMGVQLLNNCIENNKFDVASDLVQKFPNVLCHYGVCGGCPILILAKVFSSLFPRESGHKTSSPLKQLGSNPGEYILAYLHHLLGGNKPGSEESDGQLVCEEAREFLQLVCLRVPTFDTLTLRTSVYPAMIEASRNGNIEFINEMLCANPNLIFACDNEDKTMVWHAIVNRQEKVFNLIYATTENKDFLPSYLGKGEGFNNILHIAARLPPKSILERTSKSPALQMQRELQWFEEVWRMVKPLYRGNLNQDGLTPRELFDEEHNPLVDAGETSMKNTAQSCTVVGALIVTIMFAALFTVPGGNKEDTGYPFFLNDALFKIFIACDALSLSTSTASILIFLEILTSSYVDEDFLLYLPTKAMLGLLTLFVSIATMMLTFCAAIAIMFNRQSHIVLPIALLASSPVALFMPIIFTHVYQIYMSTFGPSIFDKNTKFPRKKDDEEVYYSSRGERLV